MRLPLSTNNFAATMLPDAAVRLQPLSALSLSSGQKKTVLRPKRVSTRSLLAQIRAADAVQSSARARLQGVVEGTKQYQLKKYARSGRVYWKHGETGKLIQTTPLYSYIHVLADMQKQHLARAICAWRSSCQRARTSPSG